MKLAVALFFCCFSLLLTAKPCSSKKPNSATSAYRRVTKEEGKTLQLESLSFLEIDFAATQEILAHPERFATWLLPHVNEPVAGKTPVFWLNGLSYDAHSQEFSFQYEYRHPIFGKKSERRFKYQVQSSREMSCIAIETVENQDALVEKMEGRFYLRPLAPGQIEVFFEGKTVLRSWLVFQLLPEGKLGVESDIRSGTLFRNFRRESERVHAATLYGSFGNTPLPAK